MRYAAETRKPSSKLPAGITRCVYHLPRENGNMIRRSVLSQKADKYTTTAGTAGSYACGECVRRAYSFWDVPQFSTNQEAPASIGGSSSLGNDARKIKFSPRKISEGEIAKMLNKKKDKKERCNNGMEQEGDLDEQQ